MYSLGITSFVARVIVAWALVVGQRSLEYEHEHTHIRTFLTNLSAPPSLSKICVNSTLTNRYTDLPAVAISSIRLAK